MSKSTRKRYTQRQLTEIFCHQANIPLSKSSEFQKTWWVNPIDSDSLRLSFAGLKFAKGELKLDSWEFEVTENLTFKHLLQLERSFTGMYFLLNRINKTKIILFDEQEAVMLSLYANDLVSYLDTLARAS